MKTNDLKVVNRNIDELIEAEYNPRQLSEDQFTAISDSIKRFGLVDPILVNMHKDRKNIIIGGHQRTKVAKHLGYETIPTIELSLTLDKEKELNIRLNKNTGAFDFDMLANHFEVADLTDWGFQEWEIGNGWDSDIESLDNIDDHTDGISAQIKISFENADDKESMVNCIDKALAERGFNEYTIN